MIEKQTADRWLVLAFGAVLLAAVHREVVGHTTLAILGSYNLTTTEPALAVLILAVLRQLMLRRHRSRTVTGVAALVVAFLVGIGVLRGFMINPGQALISLRATGILGASMALVAWGRLNEPDAKAIGKLTVACALALSGLVILRLVSGPTLFYQAAYVTELEINDGGRGLSGAGAALIAVASVLSFARMFRLMRAGRPYFWSMLLVVALTLALLLSRQTSATLAGVSGLLIVAFYERGPAFVLRRVAILTGVAMVGSAFLLVPDPVTLIQSLLPNWITGDVWRRASNLVTRQLIWNGIMADFANWSLLDRAIGLPAGVKPSIVVLRWGGVYWQVSAHSMYYGTLIYAGVVGLLSYLAFGLGTVIGSLRGVTKKGPDGDIPSAAAVLGIVAVIAVFGVSYEIRNELAMLLALAALSILSWRRRPIPLPADLSQSQRHFDARGKPLHHVLDR